MNKNLKQRQHEGAQPSKAKGAYLVGTCYFNPHTGEQYYWIKVGSTRDSFKKRMRGYATHNPMVWKIDYIVSDDLEIERIYQGKLEYIALEIGYGSLEWYRVTREDYLDISKKGFEWFNDR